MRPIKLLTLISRNYVIIFTLFTFIFFALFFFIIQKSIFQSTDEGLSERKSRILKGIGKNENYFPTDTSFLSDFRITPVKNQVRSGNHFIDTLIYEEGDKETHEFRKLSTIVTIKNQQYLLEIIASSFEKTEIITSIIKTLSMVFLLMVITFLVVSWLFSRTVWKPFYYSLNKLNQFEIDSSINFHFKPVRITEFNTLNRSLTELTMRVRNSFENQKQFIENASHELQTPLAINQNKLEQLIDDPTLTEAQSEIVQTLISSTQRMIRLNKTLLLLSKIENEQFPETEAVAVADLIKETLYYFEDRRDANGILVHTHLDEKVLIKANKILMDLLVSNLIKNAFVHNKDGGTINIRLAPQKFTISNTSEGTAIPAEKLFQRFYKNTSRKESWGLGLAIVKKICTMNHWEVSYTNDKGMHTFTVLFN